LDSSLAFSREYSFNQVEHFGAILSSKTKMSINIVKQFQISSEPAMVPLSFPLCFDFARSPRHVFLIASKGGDQIPA